MIDFFRTHKIFLGVAASWVLVTIYGQGLIYAWLPITILFLKAREYWAELLFGMLTFLVLSDMDKHITEMFIIKSAKNVFIIMLAGLFILERKRFWPFSRVFIIFLPFFVYSFFPIIWSKIPSTSFQKTISYGLMFLIIPNCVLCNCRLRGWDFFRDLLHMMAFILLAGLALELSGIVETDIGGRFRGLFGNPN